MHRNPVVLRLRPNHVSSHSAVDQDVECVFCSLPGGFQDLLPIKTLCRFRLRLHAGCIPLLQTPTDVGAASNCAVGAEHANI